MSIFVSKIFSWLLHPIKILNGVYIECKIIFFGQALIWIAYGAGSHLQNKLWNIKAKLPFSVLSF
jgi:hypothetical protein